ncbi:MAG: SDR family oxidoreductase [Bacteroidota bacterium]
MKVFVTGASGFIGSAVVKELLTAGHEVIGLARSNESAKAINEAGAQVLKGGLDDLDSLKQGALQADGIIHTAFIHDFNQYAKAADTDKAAIEAMGEVLKGTNKPIVVTGGILGLPKTNGFVTETDAAPGMPRASEVAAMILAENDVNASVIRLPPSVHDKGDKGFIPFIINQARIKSLSAYVGDGKNRWPAVHRLDAARTFRLGIEKAAKGERYNAIGDEGVSIRDIAEVISKKLNLPLASITNDEAIRHFEWMSRFIVFDNPATCYKTQEQLGWKPTHVGLLEDMERHYF